MLFTYISPYSKIKKSSNTDSTGGYTIRKRTGHFKRTSLLFRGNFFYDTPQTCQDPGVHLCRTAIGGLPAPKTVFLLTHTMVGQQLVMDGIHGASQFDDTPDQLFIIIDTVDKRRTQMDGKMRVCAPHSRKVAQNAFIAHAGRLFVSLAVLVYVSDSLICLPFRSFPV